MRAVSAALLLLALPALRPARAQDEPEGRDERPTATVTRLPPGAGLVLDGDLSDAAWAGVPPLQGLRTREPVENGEPSERTEVRLAHDGRTLWVGVLCFDSEPGAIRATQLRRDADLTPDDRIRLIFDTLHDRANAYFFAVGPAGSYGDALISGNGREYNKAWDGIWEARSSITPEGWCVEISIPLRTLAVSADVSTWGFNFERSIRRKREDIAWASPVQDSDIFRVRDAGELAGFSDLDTGLGIDWVPYAKAVAHTDSSDDKDLLGRVGGEMFWQITPGLTGAATVNTDFAETEVDERLVNLTRFPLFFPEKRKFFLQDAGVFAFDTGEGSGGTDLLPFFSRRIGLDASGEPVPITAGAKVSGFEGPWSLGVLAVRTGKTSDTPAADLLVARARRTLGEHVTVGGILTSGDPTSSRGNHVVGADWRWSDSAFLGDSNLEITAFGLHSETEGATGGGGAFGAEVDFPNDRWDWRLRAREIGEDFNPALGFVERTGIREADGELSFNPRPGGLVRQLSFSWLPDYVEDLDGRLATVRQELGVSAEFESGEEAGLSYTPTIDRVDEAFDIVPGLTIPADRYEFGRWEAAFGTAVQRPLVFGASTSWGGFYGGHLRRNATSLDWRPGGAFQMGLEYETDELDLPGGDFTVRIASASTEFDWSPRLSWRNIVQYDNVSRRLGWNSRLRWTLEPGDDLYVVLNQGWDRTLPTSGDGHQPLVPVSTDLTLKLARTISF